MGGVGSITCNKTNDEPNFNRRLFAYRTPAKDWPEKSVGAKILWIFGDVVEVTILRWAIPDALTLLIFITFTLLD